jgi:hypothetical protein
MKDPDPCNAIRRYRRANAERNDTWRCGYKRGHDGLIHASRRADGTPQRRWLVADGMDSYGPCLVGDIPIIKALLPDIDESTLAEQQVTEILKAIEALGYAIVPTLRVKSRPVSEAELQAAAKRVLTRLASHA